MGMTYPLATTEYSTGGVGADIQNLQPYLTWLTYILKQDDASIPKVISTSEGNYEQHVPYSYAKAVCEKYAQLGARGVSVFLPRCAKSKSCISIYVHADVSPIAEMEA